MINALDDAITLLGASFSAGYNLGNPIIIWLSVAALNMRSKSHSVKNDTE